MKDSTKRLLLIFTLVATLVPPFLLLPFPALMTPSTVSVWLADTLGYVGIVLLLWMSALGAKSLVGLVFRDLAPALQLHKWLGTYAVVLIFAHPLLVMLGYGETLLYPFLPAVGTVFERGVTLGRIGLWVLLLAWVSSALLRGRMAFRPWKYLHYLAYLTVPFALLHIPNTGSYFMSETLVKGYFLTLVVAYVAVTLLRLRGWLGLDTVAYRVHEQQRLNETDFLLVLEPTGAQRLQPRRGQYSYLRLGGISEDHPFSILDYDQSTGRLTFAYRVYGSYTRLMSQLQPGQLVKVGGPYGEFMADIDSHDRPLVYISGGIGITPFLAPLRHYAGGREQWLFAANRTHASASLLREAYSQIGDHLVAVFSRESTPPGPGERRGRINTDMLQEALKHPARYEYYLCGPPAMMHDVSLAVERLAVPRSQIHAEKFGW